MSCRQQIAHGTGRPARHPVQIVREALDEQGTRIDPRTCTGRRSRSGPMSRGPCCRLHTREHLSADPRRGRRGLVLAPPRAAAGPRHRRRPSRRRPVARPPEYVDLVVEAAAGVTDLVVVAQSLGAFTALPACARLDVRHLFLLNAMIPAPGETAGEWWENTGSGEARAAAARAGGYDEAFDVDTLLPPRRRPGDPGHRRGAPRGRRRVRDAVRLHGVAADAALAGTTASSRWSSSAAWARAARPRRVEVPGGHLAALSQPEAVARARVGAWRRYWRAGRRRRVRARRHGLRDRRARPDATTAEHRPRPTYSAVRRPDRGRLRRRSGVVDEVPRSVDPIEKPTARITW